MSFIEHSDIKITERLVVFDERNNDALSVNKKAPGTLFVSDISNETRALGSQDASHKLLKLNIPMSRLLSGWCT